MNNYKKRKPRRVSEPPPPPVQRASTSFSPDEINWLAQLMTILMRGGDASVIIRNPLCQRVMQKVTHMRQTIREKSL